MTPSLGREGGNSGIFGYVNYLVEKDRKWILDTLINGAPLPLPCHTPTQAKVSRQLTAA